MTRTGPVAGTLCAILLVAACSDDTGKPVDARADRKKPTPDLGPEPDGQYFDTGAPDLKADGPGLVCDVAKIGLACTESGGECGENATCLLTISATSGVCVCAGCTADDPKTDPNEDSCPGGGANLCVPVELSNGTTKNFCFKKCKPRLGANDCGAGGPIICDPYSAANFDIDDAVCAYTGCTKDEECPVLTATPCSVSASSCPAGETCKALVSGNDDGRCVRPGKCDKASGLCDKHSQGKPGAKVGDPCASDLDCDGNMMCMVEIDEAKYYKKAGAPCVSSGECCTSCDQLKGQCAPGPCTVNRRNGYCVITNCQFGDSYTIKACPAGSACNARFFTGYCQKICDMTKPEDCRNHDKDLYGDYECRRWGNLSFNGKDPAVPDNVPVCDFGTMLPCTFFKNNPKLSCAYLGVDKTNNPTNMTCRTLDGNISSDPLDPAGFCLDDTASGTTHRNPLP